MPIFGWGPPTPTEGESMMVVTTGKNGRSQFSFVSGDNVIKVEVTPTGKAPVPSETPTNREPKVLAIETTPAMIAQPLTRSLKAPVPSESPTNREPKVLAIESAPPMIAASPSKEMLGWSSSKPKNVQSRRRQSKLLLKLKIYFWLILGFYVLVSFLN